MFRSTNAVRLLSNTALQMAPSMLPAVNPPVSTALPSDSFQLLPTAEKAGSAEDDLFSQQVADVIAWWSSPRFEGVKRPYSAEDVVSKRGGLQQTYASSLMARKLFNLLKEREAKGEPVHTSKLACINIPLPD
jgi:isocitrate lyase